MSRELRPHTPANAPTGLSACASVIEKKRGGKITSDQIPIVFGRPIEQLPCAARRFCEQSVTVDDDRGIAQAWSSKRPMTWRSWRELLPPSVAECARRICDS